MVHIRFPTLQDLNACFEVDGLVETLYVWQMHRSLSAERISVTLQRVRLPRPMRIPYPPMGESLRRRYEAKDGLWVAVDQGRVVGFIEAQWDPDTGMASVHHLVVDRHWRRQGIGSALLRRAAQAARDRGMDRMVAQVNAKNDPAVQFLRAHGFEFVGYHEAFFPSGDIALYLARPISRWV